MEKDELEELILSIAAQLELAADDQINSYRVWRIANEKDPSIQLGVVRGRFKSLVNQGKLIPNHRPSAEDYRYNLSREERILRGVPEDPYADVKQAVERRWATWGQLARPTIAMKLLKALVRLHARGIEQPSLDQVRGELTAMEGSAPGDNQLWRARKDLHQQKLMADGSEEHWSTFGAASRLALDHYGHWAEEVEP